MIPQPFFNDYQTAQTATLISFLCVFLKINDMMGVVKFLPLPVVSAGFDQ